MLNRNCNKKKKKKTAHGFEDFKELMKHYETATVKLLLKREAVENEIESIQKYQRRYRKYVLADATGPGRGDKVDQMFWIYRTL